MSVASLVSPLAPVLLYGGLSNETVFKTHDDAHTDVFHQHVGDPTVPQACIPHGQQLAVLFVVIATSFVLAMNRSNFKFHVSWIFAVIAPLWYLLFVAIDTSIKYGVGSIVNLKDLSTYKVIP